MLKSISMRNVASYGSTGVKLDDLNKVNLIYGNNGTGKTTISKYLRMVSQNYSIELAPGGDFGECNVEWEEGQPHEKILVYNREFKRDNISATEIPGVFVMGRDDIEHLAAIEGLKQQIKEKKADLARLASEIDKTESSYLPDGQIYDTYLKVTDDKLATEAKAIYPDSLKNIQKDRARRLIKVLDLFSQLSTSAILSEEDLKHNVSIINESDALPLSTIGLPSKEVFRRIETDEIWMKAIVGSGDLDFSGFITRLGMSDWVKHGFDRISETDGICPFCQQQIVTADLISKFNDFFDESYKKAEDYVENQKGEYQRLSDSLIKLLTSLSHNSAYDGFYKSDRLEAIINSLQGIFKSNLLLMTNKKNSLSDKVTIEDGTMIYQSLEDFISEVNEAIIRRNDLITQKKAIKKELPDNVLRTIIFKYRTEIEAYCNKRREAEQKAGMLKAQHQSLKDALKADGAQLTELQSQSSDTSAVALKINFMLERQGFTNFKVQDHGNSTYCLVRENGERVKDTLSEGEETLITFLYYIHLLEGSTEVGQDAGELIAVIDDPISSLDNSVLSYVGREIKELIYRVGDESDNIKQIIVLTHNINFYKSLNRLPVKDEQKKNPKKRFYALEKDIKSRETIVTIPKKGMIESEYNQMWDILKTTIAKISDDNSDEENKIYKYTVQNTMRRIYESFFANTCNYYNNDIALLFREKGRAEDEANFREFVDWINEGSHSADMEDIKSLPSNEVILNYMKVFESAFDITGNHGQFKQMMK